MLGTIGLVGGIMCAYLRSSQRLTGHMQNNEEIVAHGIMSAADLAEARRRENYHNLDMVDAKK